IMSRYYIITFKNTNDAISGEEFLRKRKIKIDVVPTPVVITQSCGISIRLNLEEMDKIKLLIYNSEFLFKNIYLREEDGYKLIHI
ncbi:DUF3343 domain-containing protein, partial [Clostridium sp.]|uniref:DUF3343 domain-containing protein n=2 Tax=Clostridium sp. TaxID=1506 RepID=UPI0025C659F6